MAPEWRWFDFERAFVLRDTATAGTLLDRRRVRTVVSRTYVFLLFDFFSWQEAIHLLLIHT